MKPFNAVEISIHSDLTDAAIERAMSQMSSCIQDKFPEKTVTASDFSDVFYLNVSVWDAKTACLLMVKMASFIVMVTPYYSQDEWSLKCEHCEIWSPGA